MHLTPTAERLNVSTEARQLAAGLLQTPCKAITRAHYEALAAEATAITLTTADIAVFASKQLSSARAQAAAHHANAIANAGTEKALHSAKCIDIVRGWASETYLLASLVSQCGDAAGSDVISRDVDSVVGKLIDMAYTARMLSMPGWDLATRSFPKAVPVSARDEQPHTPGAEHQAGDLQGQPGPAAVAHGACDLETVADALLVGAIDPLPQGMQQTAQRTEQHDLVGHLQRHCQPQDQQADADHQQRLVPAVDDQGAHQFAHLHKPRKVDWLNEPDAIKTITAALDGIGESVILTGGKLELLSNPSKVVPA